MAKTIVCGLGQIGFRTALLLMRLGQEVVVVTRDAKDHYRSTLEALGVPIHLGDARVSQLLEVAGLADARALVICSGDDLVNIEIALDARNAKPDIRLVLRLTDNNLAEVLQTGFEFASVIPVSELTAPAYAMAALDAKAASSRAGSGAIERIIGTPTWEGRRWVLAEVEATDPRIYQKVADDKDNLVDALIPWESWVDKSRVAWTKSKARKRTPFEVWQDVKIGYRYAFLGVALLATFSTIFFARALELRPSEAFYFVITTLTTTGYGDITPKGKGLSVLLYTCFMMMSGSVGVAVMYSAITDQVVRARLDSARGRRKVRSSGHIVVVGLGEVGAETVRELERLGASPVVIDDQTENSNRDALTKKSVVIRGDARTRRTLERANVDEADTLLVLTGNDAVNLSVALAAKQMNPKLKTVIRVFDHAFAGKVERGFGVTDAISVADIAAPHFAGAALFPNAVASFAFQDRLLVLQDLPGESLGLIAMSLK